MHVDNDMSAFRGRRRPGYEALLASVQPGDAIAVTELSRLTRHPRELEDLVEFVERHQVDITALRAGQLDLATSGGRMIARVLGSIARHESEQLGERVSARHTQNAAAGKAHGGGTHYGYRRSGPGELEIDPEQADVIRWAVDRVLNGASINALVIEMNERGLRSARGGRWQPSSLGKLLRSPAIAGLRTSGGEIIGDAAWPAIIDRATHERLVARLTHAPVGPRVRRNLLAGFVRCGECGRPMKGRTEGRTGDRGRQYACDRTSGGCGSNSASADRVEAYVVDLVIGTAATIDPRRARARRSDGDATAIAADLAADERLLTDLAADYGARVLNRSQFLAAQEPVNARIAAAKAKLATGAKPADLTLVRGLTPERWKSLTFDQRRQVIGLFLDRVVIAKGKRGRVFDYDRISIPPDAWKL